MDIKEQANFIWSIADLLRGNFKQSEYGKVILPFTVLRRFDCVLAPSKEEILERNKSLAVSNKAPIFKKYTGHDYYNVSKFDFEKLIDDSNNIDTNLKDYINGFSDDVKEILDNFEIATIIEKLKKAGLLYLVVQKFSEINLGADTIDNLEMGYMFEELIRKFSEQSNETAGEHFTPREVIELMVEVLLDTDLDEITTTDGKVITILDPACGTAGFLIAAMHQMLSKTEDEAEQMEIRKNRLFGIELQDYMFTIATTNMILRGDGKSNLENQDFLAQNPSKIQLKGCTVGMMNPPYSQGSKQNPELYEINFVNHLLESLVEGAKVAVIVPQSTFTGKTKDEQNLKVKILKNHTLEGVITLNKNTFYGVGTNPCIGIFTVGIPHSKTKKAKFINFENDGYIVSKHIGLIDDGSAKDKKQHLLDVWNDEIEAPTKFCVATTVEATDEWLHSFYYFNDEIPSDEDFEKTIADYLTFEVNMITHGRGYLFGIDEEYDMDSEQFFKVAEDGADYV